MRASHYLSLAAATSSVLTNAQSTSSLISTSAQIALSLKSTYPNPSVALLPKPFWWWESGSAVDALLNYGIATGDKTYEALAANTILNQATGSNDFMTADATGNDDQAWWAMAALTAAEANVPEAPGAVTWLTLAQNVFNEQKARYDSSTCGGGLKWKINVGNGKDGWHYKSTITNGLFFQLAARLAKLTGDADTLAWAEKAYDWVESVQLIDGDFNVYDGVEDTENCAVVNNPQWSYNTGVFINGAAVMAAHTGDSKWTDRTKGLIAAAERNFVRDGALFETRCEGDGTCNLDQVSFKGTLARWMGSAAGVLPDVRDDVAALMNENAALVQGSWNAGVGAMGHFSSLEIVDAAIRARGDALVAAEGFLGPKGPSPAARKRSIAGRLWW
ncbi:glycoside hydrolase family 76 protein [Periconia macrospinosa]|uniref:mannan endo-1,6-alpha-mannosidase n=1 Tax=Periconia macrospinosa TaxID=97972 RepID=A0A2V1DD60_9PLEO|nr:glycoside hydrolase family 76 protein [Periconia macrospinosa]